MEEAYKFLEQKIYDFEYYINAMESYPEDYDENIYSDYVEELKEYKNLLNELERLQKENEELKQDNSKQWKERCRLSFEVDDSIPKQVLRDKIKKLSDNKDFDGDVYVEEYAVDVLKELLGE